MTVAAFSSGFLNTLSRSTLSCYLLCNTSGWEVRFYMEEKKCEIRREKCEISKCEIWREKCEISKWEIRREMKNSKFAVCNWIHKNYFILLGTKCLENFLLFFFSLSLTLRDRNIPSMHADGAYQGCLSSCKLRSRALTVSRTGKVESSHIDIQIAHVSHAILRLHTLCEIAQRLSYVSQTECR